jgi:hypothetical protein
MNENNITFARNLVKGKIAEMLFEQMLRDAGGFTVLAFGYEKILPELAHVQGDIEVERTMEIIRRAPDFAVINHETNKVHLIEVKYMKNKTDQKVLKAADRMLKSWDPSYLFVATPEGFFFDPADKILEKNGAIDPLNHKNLPQEFQAKYVGLLNEFISQSLKG